MDITFVILHYLTENETIEAVEHIHENCDTDDYKIIIVDNFSPNDSYDVLKNKFEYDDKVDLIKTERNLGFARGNNVGYKLAKEKYNPRFIVLLNNDVFIKEKHLYSKLNAEYKCSHFAVSGPRIDGPDGELQEELPKWQQEFPTLSYCDFRIKDMKERIFWGRLGLYKKACPFLRKRIYDKLGIFQNPGTPIAGRKIENLSQENYYDVVIHGCCIIFSPEYINRFEGLDDRTFFNGEERILFTRVLCNKLRTVYMPDLSVIHKGAVATKESGLKNDTEKKLVQAFKREKLSYEITREYLMRFKKENGIELHEWWMKENT